MKILSNDSVTLNFTKEEDGRNGKNVIDPIKSLQIRIFAILSLAGKRISCVIAAHVCTLPYDISFPRVAEIRGKQKEKKKKGKKR